MVKGESGASSLARTSLKNRIHSEQPNYIVQANKGIHMHGSDPLTKMSKQEKQFFLPYLSQCKGGKK